MERERTKRLYKNRKNKGAESEVSWKSKSNFSQSSFHVFHGSLTYFPVAHLKKIPADILNRAY